MTDPIPTLYAETERFNSIPFNTPGRINFQHQELSDVPNMSLVENSVRTWLASHGLDVGDLL